MSIQPDASDRPLFSYRFGSAEFDESRLELRVAGLPVEVEPRALDLLAYLLRHAGEVVTKEELLREVWASRPTVEKVLPNAILKLRRALGEANAGSIATLPRIGYRLDAAVARLAIRRPDASPLRLVSGDSVPGRPSFVLLHRLGRASVNEVWLAEHGKTHERRVYKFAVEGERLRTLMREVTLLRVLRESLVDQESFVELIDWNFETSPFYIECAYGGPDLIEWAEDHLSALDVTGRIDLFLQMADAVAAAHSVGVLHKDIKPANILVNEADRGPQVRLADFGSSGVFDSGALESLNITRMGMTIEDSATHTSSLGTPLYLAPELVTGGAATVQSDVYALGVMLYQLLSGSLAMPMVSGWEQHVPDPLLREDLLRATDGNPSRRLSSVVELTSRLRSLASRRARAVEQAQAQQQAQADRELLARTRARRPLLIALVAALALGGATALVFQQSAMRARDEARSELERANAISRFLNDELISRANPLVTAKGADATLKDVLLAASSRLEATFGGQPRAEHAVRANLAALLNTIELFDEAEIQAREAIALAPELGGESSPETIAARAVLVRILGRKGQLEQAEAELARLEATIGDTVSPRDRQLVAAARSTLLIARGDMAAAADELRRAIAALGEMEHPAIALQDYLRLDLITLLAVGPDPKQALAETDSLLVDLKGREGDQSLLVALARMASARAYDPDYAANEAALKEAQPVIAEKLGTEHSRYLQLLGELVSLSFRRQQWPEAVERSRELQEKIQRKFGDKHPLTWVSLTTFGKCLYELGDFDAAADALGRARSQLQTITGTQSALSQEATLYLAATELARGRLNEADELARTLDVQALEAGRASGLWGATVDVLRARILERRGDRVAAAALWEPAFEQLRAAGELDKPSRLYIDP